MITWMLTDKLLKSMEYSTIVVYAACEFMAECVAAMLLVAVVVW